MKLIRTERFLRDYKKPPPAVRKQADRKLLYLAQDITHPSLRVKRVRKYKHVYEGRINMDFRFLFQITTDGYILLRIGRHDILERA
jgi:mRNA-degrading endonuclease RelE of RelBE toxin-antitoxin system